METYLGVKKIEAEPLLRSTAIRQGLVKNFSETDATLLDEDGYKVVYEDGYISWSPKDVFEKAYREYKPFYDKIKCDGEGQDYKMRVIGEAEALQFKLDNLGFFIKKDTFLELPKDEQDRLQQQLYAMAYYITILSERISKF